MMHVAEGVAPTPPSYRGHLVKGGPSPPLVHVDGDLRAKRLGENQHVALLRAIGPVHAHWT